MTNTASLKQKAEPLLPGSSGEFLLTPHHLSVQRSDHNADTMTPTQGRKREASTCGWALIKIDARNEDKGKAIQSFHAYISRQWTAAPTQHSYSAEG
ncbi:hypothetical protein E2C01_048350 [Portunus trituberculatus]|uniref:Uncharacterized protein n=1 Tax=Portunus trituberculatus TaxID=210409 RepID=A0A5B7GD41_PORTR|nr:hypothetical protein [Portunus trituberculatus]